MVLIASAFILQSTAKQQIKPDTQLLNVPLIMQEMRMWCWAASGQMIMTYLNNPVSQCEEVYELYGLNCCNRNRTQNCNKGGWPPFEAFDFSFGRTQDSALKWPDLKAQINNGDPIAFSWKWEGTSTGHMMVAVGYSDMNFFGDSLHWVFVNDPYPPRRDFNLNEGDFMILPYGRYVRGKSDKFGLIYDHWDDFYNIRKISE